MIKKKTLNSQRVRRINGEFSFIPHRFLTDGFLTFLSRMELLVYFFLVLASDRYGLSLYSYDSTCSMLRITVDDYIEARDGLIKKDLAAFDGSLFHVLDLPQEPFPGENHKTKPAVIQQLIRQSFKVEGENW
jgi:hypothetical protein